MNRYPLWKYIMVVVAIVIGFVYTLPNFFGESPAVQVSSAKATIKVDASMMGKVEQSLQAANIPNTGLYFDQNGPVGTVRARLTSTDQQLRARDLLEKELNPDPTDPSYTVALNLLSASPAWLTSLHALPMYLGLDLRGGVHFLLQVDMRAALTKRYDSLTGDVRSLLRDKNVRHNGIDRVGDTIEVKFRDEASREAARGALTDGMPDLQFTEQVAGADYKLIGALKPAAIKTAQDNALGQNISTLHNRINELGVAEPIIQQQGADRIVVQLPGVQDVAKAKDILGRTATLEVRLVDDSPEAQASFASGTVPFGLERFNDRDGRPVLVRRQVVLTGENLTDAQAGFDGQSQQPAVHLTLDAKGSRIFRDVTRDNLKKRMAILLFEKGKGEVVTAPVIQSEISGGRVQISGSMTSAEAADTALLLRAGSLAAPMEIIEERTIGPSLGADNIEKGFKSVAYGFAAIAIFMMLYYGLFGVFSAIALSVNLLLLIALLSMLQATLTLPGIAAIALALGMAIDSNVLINERIREELRAGASPQQAINLGFERAWGTILDSNVTTLIAAVALLAFGSGPVRAFAIVHGLGILTSMFSAVVGARALANLWYGRRKKLQKISIGQVWKPKEV
ncbi:protein translocase subunit SecD [Pigmentiphaga litoralis]|jgi:preprotein translocase subunit SecD|uniref:protein translocase subunit SecD n=1 Tax=Pigmentiphaga litoralis TaxID=516702 RepID=UPI00167853AC|nr:protein translocase subunit SecD [Pigmentiphaga litoralis]